MKESLLPDDTQQLGSATENVFEGIEAPDWEPHNDASQTETPGQHQPVRVTPPAIS
jgi:hypothetical protein